MCVNFISFCCWACLFELATEKGQEQNSIQPTLDTRQTNKTNEKENTYHAHTYVFPSIALHPYFSLLLRFRFESIRFFRSSSNRLISLPCLYCIPSPLDSTRLDRIRIESNRDAMGQANSMEDQHLDGSTHTDRHAHVAPLETILRSESRPVPIRIDRVIQSHTDHNDHITNTTHAHMRFNV